MPLVDGGHHDDGGDRGAQLGVDPPEAAIAEGRVDGLVVVRRDRHAFGAPLGEAVDGLLTPQTEADADFVLEVLDESFARL